MPLRLAALAALVVAAAAPCAQAADRISLDSAFARVEAYHPDLKIFRYTAAGLAAEADKAAQRPALSLNAEVENVLGSGVAAGVGGAEVTVSLASVLERGGKRAARQALAQSRIDALAATREARRLDLLAEVARRYLDVLAAQSLQAIAAQDRQQRERTAEAAGRRVRAGAAPVSVELAAQAQVARAGLDLQRAQVEQGAAWRRLALLWGEREPQPGMSAEGEPALPAVPEFARIAALLEATPELVRFADEQRLREARLQLARSTRSADISWQVGLRRLQDSADWGLAGSLSLPLGSRARAEPDLRAAQAELDALAPEREAAELGLYATLAQAHGRLSASVTEAQQLRDELLPRLRKAEDAAGQAYRAGALSYLEWAQLQAETIATRRQQLAAAVEAQRALIEIQRLTASSFGAADAQKDTTP
jgi:outer membrane protein, heavy metal efflux system